MKLYTRKRTHMPLKGSYAEPVPVCPWMIKEMILMGIDHLISRRPRCRTCARCGRLQMLGIDEGVPYRIAPIPLTLRGEVYVRQLGFLTYGWHAGSFCFRDAGRITLDVKWGRPAVFATHKCDFELPVEHVDIASVPKAQLAIERASLDEEIHDEGEPPSELDVNAMFTVAELLSGRVVALQAEVPPF